jgi:hypothetical protein
MKDLLISVDQCGLAFPTFPPLFATFRRSRVVPKPRRGERRVRTAPERKRARESRERARIVVANLSLRARNRGTRGPESSRSGPGQGVPMRGTGRRGDPPSAVGGLLGRRSQFGPLPLRGEGGGGGALPTGQRNVFQGWHNSPPMDYNDLRDYVPRSGLVELPFRSCPCVTDRAVRLP